MKIAVIGTRGIPDIPGGVERHCQQLYPRIANLGHEVTVYRRSSYVPSPLKEYMGVQLCDCYSPDTKSFEAIVHTFIALLRARLNSPDVVHLHAIGPSLMTPLARTLGMKVVVTHHGPDYEREKWGRMASMVLRLGERMACLFATRLIVISKHIQNQVKSRFNRESHLIHNGVDLPDLNQGEAFLQEIGVQRDSYILAVARFVPEKGLHDLIDAYEQLNLPMPLVIAGDSDHEDSYSLSLKQRAESNDRIILTGYISGDPLSQLYAHARLFVLPSYHEGLSIALLEALSYGLLVLASDIPPNLEVNLPREHYFACGDVEALAKKMEVMCASSQSGEQKNERRLSLKTLYDWDVISRQTVDVYLSMQ